MTAPRVDVLVVGGGPAGGIVARELALGGHSVVLAAHDDPSEMRIGETLAPPAYVVLAELGLRERFDAQATASPTVLRAAWESPETNVIAAGDDPLGGWRLVDRAKLDGLLLTAAEEAGASVVRRARVRSLAHDDGWLAEIEAEERGVLRPRFVVDATGRASFVASNAGARRVPCDGLVGVVGAPVPVGEGRALGPLVEATDAGWWYSALLPDGRCVPILMTDRDLLPSSPSALGRFWLEGLAKARLTRGLADTTLPSPPRILAANSARLDTTCGADWIAVGDAAVSFDPLSAMGLWHALDSARRAAYAVSGALLETEPAALVDYELEEVGIYERYLTEHDARYRKVRRWPGAKFWARRPTSWTRSKKWDGRRCDRTQF